MATIVLKDYMIKTYATLIKGGKRTIVEIPVEYVEAVLAELEKEV